MMDITIPHFRILSPRPRAISSVMREGAKKTSRAPIFYCDKNFILSEPRRTSRQSHGALFLVDHEKAICSLVIRKNAFPVRVVKSVFLSVRSEFDRLRVVLVATR